MGCHPCINTSSVRIRTADLIGKLFPAEVEIRDKSVLSFTPALCASMQTALCVKLLVGRPAEAGTIYYFDLLNQEFETIPLV